MRIWSESPSGGVDIAREGKQARIWKRVTAAIAANRCKSLQIAAMIRGQSDGILRSGIQSMTDARVMEMSAH